MLTEKLTVFAIKVHPFIKQHNYILDLAVLGDDVVIIELNPFDVTTGACMFSWNEDQEILYGRKSDKPVFRVKEKPIENIGEIVTAILKDTEGRSKENVESCSDLLQKLSIKGSNL